MRLGKGVPNVAYIQERKDSGGKARYRVQVRKKGYPLQTATFTRKTDAKNWAKCTEAAIEERRYRNVAQAKKRTVAELIDRYIENVLPKKPRSARTQKQQLLWWREQLGLLILADLTADLIADCRDKLAKRTVSTGKQISPGSVNRYMAALSHVLTIAVKEFKWLPDSPMRDVSKMPEPKGRVRFLSEGERNRLLEACRESESRHIFVVVMLALSTGMRKGEILNLTWDDVDMERRTIVLHDTKNQERRAVPLAGKAYDLVLDLQGSRSSHSNYLFPSSVPDRPSGIKKSWYTALKRASIENFRFHDLRHSAASYLAMNGASLPEIAAVLGHKTYEMVKRYAHLSDQHTADVVERMNKKIFGGNAS